MNETANPDAMAGAPAGQPAPTPTPTPVADPAALDAARDRLQTPPATTLPLGTAEDILSAPSDLVEKVISVPEWGFSVKIRSLSAAQSAKVVQASADRKAGGLTSTFAEEMAKAQFEHGVVEPKFNYNQVNQLHHTSGPGFARVLREIDAISGTTAEEKAAAAEAFQASGRDSSPAE
jgi:hypothetical protein